MKNLSNVISVAVVLGGLLLGGCGGDGGINKVLNLDPQKSFDALTEQEREALCEDAINATKAAISQAEVCTLMGLIAAAAAGNSQEACQATSEACMKIPPQDESCQVNEDASCTATVGEIDKCLVDMLNQADKAMSGIDCSDVEGSLQKLGQLEATPASCIDLAGKCPDLIDS